MDLKSRFCYCAIYIIVVLPFLTAAQGQRFWIQFSDKNGTPYSLQQPSHFLSEVSILRRAAYNIPLHSSDLPVNPAYIKAVDDVPHTHIHFALRWLNGVVVSFESQNDEAAGLAAISALPFVESESRVRKVRRDVPPPGNIAGKISGSYGTAAVVSYDYGGSALQTRQLNLECLHNKGYRGQGMTIAVLDAGFLNVPGNDVFDSLRNDGRLLGTRDFVNGGTDAFVGGNHGTMVLSCMAANKPGVAIGSAPLASYWLLRTEEGAAETISEEYNWIRGAEFADSAGVDILTTSLGYTTFDISSQNHSDATLNGRTAPMSIAATMAARKGMFVLNAAGNSGNSDWRFIGVPADADSICTVGAVNGMGQRASFSSVGPTADNRIKPDLMARGEGTWVCERDDVCFPGNGTSFATPVLAGAVACYWQANRQLNNIRLLSRLRNSASKAKTPDNFMGYGIPDLCAVPDFDFSAFATTAGLNVMLTDAGYDELKIEVIDMFGRVLMNTENSENKIDIYFSEPGLPPGIYIVRVSTAQYGVKSKKILKPGL